MLDPAAPTRLFSSLPEGVHIERMGLVDAIEAVGAHLKKPLP
jgi:ATP-dependent DNA helicase DinG